MKCTALLVLLLSFAVQANSHQEVAKAYPEHGMVIAVRARRTSPTILTSGGMAVTISRGSYRVETKNGFYEFEERGRKPTLMLNQEIDFRVEKDIAFIPEPNGKEKKYRVISEESKKP